MDFSKLGETAVPNNSVLVSCEHEARLGQCDIAISSVYSVLEARPFVYIPVEMKISFDTLFIYFLQLEGHVK